MEGEAGLSILAEVGATFVGFISVVTVLVLQDRELGIAYRLRARVMILTSVLVTVAALTPFGLLGLFEDQTLYWRISSAIVGFLGFLIGFTQQILERKAPKGWDDDIGIVAWFSQWAAAAGSVICFTANALGVFGEPNVNLYLAGTTLGMCIPMISFISICSSLVFGDKEA